MFAHDIWPEVERRYGRKQGLLRHGAARLAGLLGAWRPFANVELARVQRLVFVCQGNICRSAYAQARAEQLGLPSASFGLGAHSGVEADPHARAAALRRGTDLAAHRARTRADLQLTPADLVLAMEPAQLLKLRELVPIGAQLSLLGLWSAEPRPHLEDPFGLSDAYFETCFGCIDDALQALAERWRAR